MAELDHVTAEAIFAKIQENNDNLDKCEMHDFVPFKYSEHSRMFKCNNCGGTIDHMGYHWYEQGLVHGEGKGRLDNGQLIKDTTK